MASKEEVLRFLNQMKEKIKVFGIIYRDDRGKNAQTLIDLEKRFVHLLPHSRTPDELSI